MTATIAARIGTTDWNLTAIRTNQAGETCDHCGTPLKNLYTVENTATGHAMTVGRSCCKNVTGWNLTAAEAARILRAAQAKARHAAAWAAFTAEYPAIAADLQDATGWKREIKSEIVTGPAFRWAHWVRLYNTKI